MVDAHVVQFQSLGVERLIAIEAGLHNMALVEVIAVAPMLQIRRENCSLGAQGALVGHPGMDVTTIVKVLVEKVDLTNPDTTADTLVFGPALFMTFDALWVIQQSHALAAITLFRPIWVIYDFVVDEAQDRVKIGTSIAPVTKPGFVSRIWIVVPIEMLSELGLKLEAAHTLGARVFLVFDLALALLREMKEVLSCVGLSIVVQYVCVLLPGFLVNGFPIFWIF